jgi:hypothetical protein
MFTMKSEVVGQPSVASTGLVQSVGQTICERQCFTISKFSCEFTQTSHTVLCEIITVKISSHKFCAGQKRSMALVLASLEQYHGYDNEFLIDILTNHETSVSFVNVVT